MKPRGRRERSGMPVHSRSCPNPLLSICLVNYNDGAHLPECLSSIESNADIDFEVIVIDNHSEDGSAVLIEEKFPWIKLIRNPENVGFGRANNQAARLSRGDFILFMNTDILLYPRTIALLLDEMRADPLIGVAGPALVNSEGVFQVSFGNKATFFTEVLNKGILNHHKSRALLKGGRKKDVGWVSGAFLLARKKAILEVGLFDENFFIYFEDIDLCLRVAEKGWKIVFFPEAVSFHWGGATTVSRHLQSRLEYRRSQVLFYRKHNSRFSQALLRLYLRWDYYRLVFRGSFRKDAAGLRGGFRDLLKKKGAQR